MKHNKKDIYGIQFHPKVHHTPKGEKLFLKISMRFVKNNIKNNNIKIKYN